MSRWIRVPLAFWATLGILHDASERWWPKASEAWGHDPVAFFVNGLLLLSLCVLIPGWWIFAFVSREKLVARR